MFPSKAKLFSVCAATVLTASVPAAFSQNLLSNGDFSNNDGASKVDFSTTASNAAASTNNPIPYWGLTAAPANGVGLDTGIQSGIGPGGTTYAAFEQYENAGTGTFPGSIFNLTSTPVVAGETYTLTFVGEDTSGNAGNTDPVNITFFSQAGGPSASYTFAGTTLQTTMVSLADKNVTPYPTYMVPFTATTSGGDIGIEVTNVSTGDYNQITDFVLTAAAVPEPSTYALLAVGCVGGLVLLRRRKLA